LRLEVYIDGSRAKDAFFYLYHLQSEIEAVFGQPLSWEELPDARSSRIAFYMPGVEKRENRDRWKPQHEWILTWGPKFSEAIRPFIAGLDFEPSTQAAET
jgi:hypothetical protein